MCGISFLRKKESTGSCKEEHCALWGLRTGAAGAHDASGLVQDLEVVFSFGGGWNLWVAQCNPDVWRKKKKCSLFNIKARLMTNQCLWNTGEIVIHLIFTLVEKLDLNKPHTIAYMLIKTLHCFCFVFMYLFCFFFFVFIFKIKLLLFFPPDERQHRR